MNRVRCFRLALWRLLVHAILLDLSHDRGWHKGAINDAWASRLRRHCLRIHYRVATLFRRASRSNMPILLSPYCLWIDPGWHTTRLTSRLIHRFYLMWYHLQVNSAKPQGRTLPLLSQHGKRRGGSTEHWRWKQFLGRGN